ncbi:MAG: RNA polymerase sigma factor [Bacteroidales bacterium]
MTAIEFKHQILGYQNNLKGFAYSLVSDRDDALDLVQETYLKALSYYHKLSDYSNLKVWIMTIMRNLFINKYRRAVKNRNIIEEKQAILTPRDMGYDTVDSYYSHNEISKAVNLLKPELREPFLMFVDGFKYNEIADELQINIGTVKSRIFTARQKLMQELKDFN